MYCLDGDKMRPDPASQYQPMALHGPSQVVDRGFAWTDDGWKGIPLERMVLYEVHMGTATPEGTFDAFVGKLPYLKSLGVTADLNAKAPLAGDVPAFERILREQYGYTPHGA